MNRAMRLAAFAAVLPAGERVSCVMKEGVIRNR